MKKIYFVSALPPTGSGYYCHYRHKKLTSSTWIFCDLRSAFRKNQDKWLDDFGVWHGRISAIFSKATSWWWVAPLSRPIAYHPKIVDHLFHARGIVELLDLLKGDVLFCVEFPPEVALYVRDMAPEWTVIIENKKNSFDPKTLSLSVSAFFQKWGRITRYSLHIFFSIFSNMRRHFKINFSSRLVVFSELLNIDQLEPSGDHFFHHLLDDLPGYDKKEILWFYLEKDWSLKSRAQLEQIFIKRGQKVITVLDLILPIDVIWIFYQWILVKLIILRAQSAIPSASIGGRESQIFTFDYSGLALERGPFILSLLVHRAGKRLFRSSLPEAVLYPYEEKGTERALLKALHQASPISMAVAYAHAIYNQGLLYLRFRHDGLPGRLAPDAVICTGPRIRQWFIQWGRMLPDRITSVGSSRYSSALAINRSPEERKTSLKVLMIIGLSHELDSLVDLIEEEPHLFQDCCLVIRRYSFGWILEQNEAFARLQTLGIKYIIDNKTLCDQLRDCDVSLISSTSAALQSMLSDRPVIYIDLHNVIECDPFSGKGDLSSLLRCDSAHELKLALVRVREMSMTKYTELVDSQRRLAKEIYMEPNKKILAELLSVSRTGAPEPIWHGERIRRTVS